MSSHSHFWPLSAPSICIPNTLAFFLLSLLLTLLVLYHYILLILQISVQISQPKGSLQWMLDYIWFSLLKAIKAPVFLFIAFITVCNLQHSTYIEQCCLVHSKNSLRTQGGSHTKNDGDKRKLLDVMEVFITLIVIMAHECMHMFKPIKSYTLNTCNFFVYQL